jgi:CheY-like chemotaxis protein
MTAKRKVLIVDDEPDAIDVARVVLEELGDVAIVSANDGASGLAMAKEAKPDLILLDVQMPGKGGFDVFLDLKKESSTKDIPIIMVTGVAEKTGIGFSSADMGAFMHGEPEAYIEKPVEPAELQKAAAKLLGL